MRSVMCLYCDKSFSSRYQVMDHIEDIHSRLLSICPICLEGRYVAKQKNGKLVYTHFSGRRSLYYHCLKAKENKEWHYALAYLFRAGYGNRNFKTYTRLISFYNAYIDKIREYILSHLNEISMKAHYFTHGRYYTYGEGEIIVYMG